MNIKCGTDIIEISRVKESICKNGKQFLQRVYTQNEIEYCEQRNNAKFQSYAVRFAAKEAVVKAFGTGISQGISFKHIEILNNCDGKPEIIFYDKAKEYYANMNAISIDISLSHSKEHALAYAVILQN